MEAYGALVRRYQHDARRTAAAFAGAAAADDAAQEAFVRAFRSLRRFRGDAPFRPWLLAIVANCARNERRSTSRWTRRAERVGEVRGDAGAAPSAEDTALADERRARLLVAIDGLPRHARDVVVCRYLVDLSEAETADVLGIARGTVKSRLARALDRLEEALRDE